MAVRTATVAYAPNGDRHLAIATWVGLLQSSTDVGNAIELPGADRSAQLTGTLGVGGVVTMQGSNVDAPATAAASTDWGDLHDTDGNVLTLSAIGMLKQVIEVCRWMRPRVTAGDVDTDVGVKLLARKA